MASKAKSFRRRGDSDDEEEEDTGPALLRRPPARPGAAGSRKKTTGTGGASKGLGPSGSSSSLTGNGAGGGGASKKASMLSFEEEEDGEEGGAGGGLQALKSKAKPKKKKAFASRSLEQAMEEMEGEAAAASASGGGPTASFFASGAGAGGGGGEYTVEKLAALRKGQNFQVSTKPAKGAAGDKGKRVTFVAPDGSEALPPGHEEVGDEELDKEEVARLKREKRERMRREALAAGGDVGPEGSGDEEGEESFIPLDGGQQLSLSKGERRLEQAGLAGEQDVEVEDDWESEMIRRGARKPSAASAAATAAALGGNGSLSSSLNRLAMGGAGGVGAPTFKTVEGVLRELRTTKERVDEAHEKNERAAAKTQGELEAARAACAKLQGEFDETAERFQFFQDTREYLSSLCGCLREKEGMVQELEGAVAQIRRDAAERRWTRRVEDQEDALEELRAQRALRSLQGYRPTVVTSLGDGDGENAKPQEPEVDEFGRDRSVVGEATRERRRAARLARRETLLKRLQGASGDTAEAEARVSGGEESESEVAQTRSRRRKLLEAAAVIFEDAAEEFSGVDPVARRFELWRRRHPRDYQTAYVSVALPQVFEPLVRVEMARWDPLAAPASGPEGEDGEVATALEGFAWYERLFAFGQAGPEEQQPQQEEDPDERLVPTLVEKVAVQLLGRMLKEAYDPLSSQETERAVAAIQAVLIYEPGKHALEELLKAPLDRLRQAARALCVPLLEPTAAGPEAVAFQRRQLFRAVKLYANVGKWHEVLAPRALAPLALGELLEGAIAPALGNRLEQAGQEEGARLEALGTLEALLTATPPALLLEKSAPPLTTTLAVLDRIGQQAGQAAPVLSTVKRLRVGFGGSN